jgi:L-ascorbate metabolism protein UlaG (beta-lactamase superfamily)
MSNQRVITYLGQSGFFLESNGSRLLIDPSNKKSGDVDGDLVYCTHVHSDHTKGVDFFMERNPSANFVCGEQTAAKFTRWGERVKIVCDEDTYTQGPWTLKVKYLRHGIFIGVQNLAVIVKTENFSFGHCGDATDIHGFPMEPVDVLAIPIGGGFTANPRKALKMVENLDDPLPIIVPMHWLFRNPSGFCEMVHQMAKRILCVVPKAGELLPI